MKRREYQCNVCASIYERGEMSMPHVCCRDRLKLTAHTMFDFFKAVTIIAHSDAYIDEEKVDSIKALIQEARNRMAKGEIPAVKV